MIETTEEKLNRIFRGDPRDPLETEIATFNQRIAAGRAAAARGELKVAAPKKPVWQDETDRLDPLFDEVATHNERIAAARKAAS